MKNSLTKFFQWMTGFSDTPLQERNKRILAEQLLQTVRQQPNRFTVERAKTLLAVHQFLMEEYDSSLLVSSIGFEELQMPRANIEDVIAELHTRNRFLGGKKMIPLQVNGTWQTTVSSFFLDDKGRYLPQVLLKEYLLKLIEFFGYLAEFDLDDNADHQYNVRFLNDSIQCYTAFSVVLLESLIRSMDQ